MRGSRTSAEPRVPGLLTRAFATGLFSGYIPWASGTFGTLVGCAVLLIPGVWNPMVLWPLTIVAFLGGVSASRRIAEHEGYSLNSVAEKLKATFQRGSHAAADPSIVVIDEIVGMWITVLHVPHSYVALAVGFVLFRAFDILKPPPAGAAEAIPGGWGIMLDDVVAAVYANLGTQLILAAMSLTGVL